MCVKCHVNTIFHGELCIMCNGCVDICPTSCLKLVSVSDIDGDEYLEKVISARYGYKLEEFQEREELKKLVLQC